MIYEDETKKTESKKLFSDIKIVITEGKIDKLDASKIYKEIENEKSFSDNRIGDTSKISELESYRRRRIDDLYKQQDMSTKNWDSISGFDAKADYSCLAYLSNIMRIMKNLNNMPLEELAKMRDEEFAFKEIDDLIDGIKQGCYEEIKIVQQKFHQIAKERLEEYRHKLCEKDLRKIEEKIEDILENLDYVDVIHFD